MFNRSKHIWSVFFILNAAYVVSAQATEKKNIPATAPNEISLKDFKTKDYSAKQSFDFDAKNRKALIFQKSEENKNGQETVEPDHYQLRRGEKELNIEFGYSPFQPTFLSGEKEYDTSGRSFGMVNLRWGRVIGTPKRVTYEYQLEVTPVALALKNEVANPAYRDAQSTPNVPPTIRKTTYGFAISPAGFRFFFLPKKRLKPYISAHAGFIIFNNDIPLPDASAFNFAGDFGGGLQYQIKRNKAVTFGYKYFHISNISLGETNPGYNANVFYIGYSFFYK